MCKRFALAAPLLLLSTQFCHAHVHTLAEADTIIEILLFVVVLLLVLGVFGLYHERVVNRRNEQLLRTLNALDDYRAIVGNGVVTLDEKKDLSKKRPSKLMTAKATTTE